MCDKCLQWFHAQCVTYGEGAFLKEWFCGCHIPEMEIGQRGYSLSELRHFCEDIPLKNFVHELLEGNTQNRRLTYLRAAEKSVTSAKRLRNFNLWGVIANKKSTEFIEKRLDRLMKVKKYFPSVLPRTTSNMTKYKLDVLIPEVSSRKFVMIKYFAVRYSCLLDLRLLYIHLL